MAKGAHSASSENRQGQRKATTQTRPRPSASGAVPASSSAKSRRVKAQGVQTRADYAKSGYASRKKGPNKLVIIAAIVAVIVVGAVVFAISQCSGSGSGKVRQGEKIIVTVEPGAATKHIATKLQEAGVISSADEFSKHVDKLGQSASLQSGTYIITGGEDLDVIVRMMTNGETGYLLTIPEGYTLKQIAAQVEKTCGISADEFYALTQQASKYAGEYPFLNGVYNNSMEGFLYPDTYRIDVGARADDVVRTMLDQFGGRIQQVDMSYAASKNLTLYDVVTLASIVEKEYRHESDKEPIAAVFYNRLREGITLGSDVTTYYAVGKDLTEDLTNEDLASDSPYNTRNPNHYGLPAGPICNPSISTINAAANPAQVDYLYFFYSNKEGRTMFFANEPDFSAAWAQYGD